MTQTQDSAARAGVMRTAAIAVALATAILVAACGGSRAYGHGDEASRNGDWDAAVAYYRTAARARPNLADYRIALERAMINAGSVHMDQARAGRMDMVATRTQDATGASGAGLLATVVFDAMSPGAANLSMTGSATVPGGGATVLQFTPAAVSVR